YQNSLDQTKLMYDYYGDTSNREQLSYNLLMSPSAMNNYMPITITNSSNRVILDKKLASAARAAGIPQEGLGCTPSTLVREKFVEGLLANNVIDKSLAAKINSCPYNPGAGLGSDAATRTEVVNVTLEDVYKSIRETCHENYTAKSVYTAQAHDAKSDWQTISVHAFTSPSTNNKQVTNWSDNVNGGAYDTMTLANLMNLNNSEQQYFIGSGSIRSEQTPVTAVGMMQHYLTDDGGFVDWLKEQFGNALATEDSRTSGAVNYAAEQLKKMLTCDNGYGRALYWATNGFGLHGDDHKNDASGEAISKQPGWENFGFFDWDDRDTHTQYDYRQFSVGGSGPKYVKQFADAIGTIVPSENGREYEEYDTMANTNHIGFVFTAGNKGKDDDGNDHSTAAINLNNLAKAFLTFYANFMCGLDKVTYDVHKGAAYESRLVTTDDDFNYDVNQTVVLRTEATKDVTFYDTLLNQIATAGWTENDEIRDNSYLQEMVQNGMMFISTLADDQYYYQKNYATYNYVREVTDETAVAQAEAKYKTEKEKLNSKEQKLDLKMKNLDTEMSSLTTEYDTVKNLISKSIEKSFKRYNA
ncbi:MAG: hypothetical protein ACLSWI_09625, partial [Candidatus Gastranaerophilaceae bacterium]